MTTAIEYALMAGASYISNRDVVNQFPMPSGWSAVTNPPHFKDDATGFEAIAFTNGTDIVISFAGTNGDGGSIFTNPDKQADAALGAGILSNQLKQAPDYYLAIKASAPTGATISFTGHSLGGGLAALMAVMFDQTAFTFDQAPFRASATGTANDFSSQTDSVAKSLRAYLAGQTPPKTSVKLDAYIAALEGFNNPNPIAADTAKPR